MNFLDKKPKSAYLIIALLCFILYGNTLRNDYCLDDEIVTGPGNSTAQGVSSVKTIFTEFYQNEMGNRFDYRPLVKLSFALENEVFGIEPGIHHFFNILYYALCGCLLYNFLRKLFENGNQFALLVCLLFIVHPAHTEVVASLKNRDIMLTFIFAFLAGNFLIPIFKSGKFRLTNSILVFLFFYLAMLSKRDALVFVFIFPPLLYYIFKPKIAFGALLAVLIISCYVLLKFTTKSMVEGTEEARAVEYYENPLFKDRSMPNRIAALFNTTGFYLIQNFIPFKLLSYYGYRQIDVLSFTSAWFYLGVGGLGAIIFLFLKNLKKNSVVTAGIIFLAGGTLLYTNFVRPVPGITGDRFVFVSSIGACILMLSAAGYFLKFAVNGQLKFIQINAAARTALFIVAGLASVAVMIRNTHWKNRETLFAKDAAKAPMSAKLHSLYALELIRQFRSEENNTRLSKKELAELAMEELKKSIEVYPDFANSKSNLAYLMLATNGDAKEAKKLLESALKLKEGTPEILYNYADALARTGDLSQSEQNLLKAIKADSSLKPAYDLLVDVSWKNNTLKNAIDVHSKALKKGARKEFMFLNLGNCYARLNDTAQAVTYYDSAFTINPVNKNLGQFLYRYYSSKGSADKRERIRKLAGR